MEHEFGTGLRAHLERRVEPETETPAQKPEDAPPDDSRTRRVDIDDRLAAVAAAEAELLWRERGVAERERAFQVAVQKTVYRLSQELLENELPALPEDELAQARARRRGFGA